jgi:hypothetical protein
MFVVVEEDISGGGYEHSVEVVYGPFEVREDAERFTRASLVEGRQRYVEELMKPG